MNWHRWLATLLLMLGLGLASREPVEPIWLR
jgi:hypothetical protein